MNCKGIRLLEKGQLVTAAANGVTPVTITAQTGDGTVRRLEITCANNTLADLALCTIDFLTNGNTRLQSVPLIKFSPDYMISERRIPIEIVEGSQIKMQVTNSSANAIDVYFNFLYY